MANKCKGLPLRDRITRKPMARSLKNWCPNCQQYVAQKHICETDK